jgi:hypothetical protein
VLSVLVLGISRGKALKAFQWLRRSKTPSEAPGT